MKPLLIRSYSRTLVCPLLFTFLLGVFTVSASGKEAGGVRNPFRDADRNAAQNTAPNTGQNAQPIRVRDRHFEIPFQLQTVAGVAGVELLVSRDFGTTWAVFTKVAPQEGKFSFPASGNGEYWFSFRTIPAEGFPGVRQEPVPHLRILVDVEEGRKARGSTSHDPSSAETGPVLPPKPLRSDKRHADFHSGDAVEPDGHAQDGTWESRLREGEIEEDFAGPVDAGTLRHLNPVRTEKPLLLPSVSRNAGVMENTVENGTGNVAGNAAKSVAGPTGNALPPLEMLMADIGQIYASKAPAPGSTEGEAERQADGPGEALPGSHEAATLPDPVPADSSEAVTPPATGASQPGFPPLVFEPEDPRVRAEDATDIVDASADEPERSPEANADPPPPSTPLPAKPKAPPLPGCITKVDLQGEKWQKRVVIQWALKKPQPFEITEETSRDVPGETALRVDVLRGLGPEGPWVPIVIGIENTGQYWWAVSEADFQPFYIAVRTQAADGRFTFDRTRRPIRIHSEMLGK